jgi:hypothetical protein
MARSILRKGSQRLAAVGIGLGVAAATFLANPGAANAGFWGCRDNYSCYYDGAYGGGRKWVAPSCGFFNLGDSRVVNPVFNDKITSITNGSSSATITLYNWQGQWVWLGTMGPGDWSGQLKASIDNKIDAVQISC